MNITIITILLPYPLNSGGAQAQYNMIDHLRHSHHITMVFPENANNSKQALDSLQQLWPEVTFAPYSYLQQLRNPHFFWNKAKRAFNLRFRSHDIRFRKERILQPYGYDLSQAFTDFTNQVIHKAHTDVIQVEFYPFLELVERLPTHIKKVFIHHEIRYKRNERMMAKLGVTSADSQCMTHNKEREIALLNRYDTVITLTQTDKNILFQDGVKTPISVSPACINSPTLPYKPWTGKLVFVGGYSHIPNQEGIVWLLHAVLPLVHEPVSFEIIGKGWQNLSITKGAVPVSCLGFVEHLEDKAYGSIMVVPILSGSGMRMKILEGAALSMPIITTTVGVEGLEFKHGESCLIADTPQEFADAINLLCQDASLREKLAHNAQAVYTKKYSAIQLLKTREHIYHQILCL